MADYMIIRQAVKENTATVVVEFPVPGGTNDAGIAWQDVVAEVRALEGNVGVTQNPHKQGDGTYISQLDAGQLYELVETIEYSANSTDPQKVAVLDAAVSDAVSAATSDVQSLYIYYGLERTV